MVRKAGNADDIFPAENKRMFDGIFQLADVAGPFVQHQRGDGSLGYPCNVFSRQTVKVFYEMICQQGDVLLAVRQRRQRDSLSKGGSVWLIFYLS